MMSLALGKLGVEKQEYEIKTLMQTIKVSHFVKSPCNP